MKFDLEDIILTFTLSVMLGITIGVCIASHADAVVRTKFYITSTENYIGGFNTGVKWQQTIEEHNRLMKRDYEK